MINPTAIRDIMEEKPLCLPASTSIVSATHRLLEKKISSAPVIDNHEKLVGILTQKDCLRATLNAHYHRDWGDNVKDYMIRDVKTMDVEIELTAAAIEFVNTRFRSFPVVDNGELVGLIKRTDVLRALFSDSSESAVLSG